nr:hypothetical protein [uncultured Dethiosulfovibrio sp.]
MWYYVFAAKGLQDFILKGDKLRLMVGGSAIIEDLSVNFFGKLFEGLGLRPGDDYDIISKAAGGVRVLFFHEGDGEEVLKVVPMALSLYASGLDFVQTLLPVKDGLAETMKKAERVLMNRRGLAFPSLPPAGPLVERCPRSGLPAVGSFSQGGDREPADLSMVLRDRASSGLAHSFMAEKALGADRAKDETIQLPMDMAEIVSSDKGDVAVVHIDGNGLGAIVIKLFEGLSGEKDYSVAKVYERFSSAIQSASERSLQIALSPLVEETVEKGGSFYPFRPLVCAGDDVTVILRGADGLDFADRFLCAFEEESAKELRGLNLPDLSEGLTACAGIAYVKSNFPFSQAYELSESLCSYAKDKTARKTDRKTDRSCSSLAFWRVTTTMADDFSGIIERELTFRNLAMDTTTTMTMMPYTTGGKTNGQSAPSLASLRVLKDSVSAMPRGTLRGILSKVAVGKDRACRDFERIIEVHKDKGDYCKKLLEALEAITGRDGKDSLFSTDNRSPLNDVISLCSVDRIRQEGL